LNLLIRKKVEAMLPEATQISHYRLLRHIGGGGMGDVYLAENLHLNTQVAIKVIKPAVISDPDARRLFLREAKAAAMLDHPYILPLFDYGEATINGDIYPYMVMPLRQEGSLKTWLKQHYGMNRPSPAIAVAMISQAASALQHAHDHQIIHLDVKPSNFLLRSSTEKPQTPDLLLADFGLAKVMNSEVSMSQASRGTPPYMAPEQWRGSPVAASDQYALATMAYEILTDRTPFQGKSMEEFMYQHLYTTPEPPAAFNPHLARETNEVFAHALAKNSKDRFASIAAFANALRQAVSLDEKTQSTHSPRILYTVQDINRTESLSGAGRSPDLPGATQISTDTPDDLIARRSTQAHETGNASPDTIEELATTPITSANKKIALKTALSLTPRVWLLTAVALLVVLASTGLYLLLGVHPGHSLAASTTTRATVTATTQASTATPSLSMATATAAQQLYSQATSGKPILNDPLANNSSNQWEEIPTVTQGGTCAFMNGAYHVTQNRSDVYFRCVARRTDYTNFAYQVEATIQAGDEAGIVFRFDKALQTFYAFHFSTDGAYRLDMYNNQGFVKTLSSGTNSAIKAGHNQTNLLTVIAQNAHLTIFVNTHYVTSVIDSAYTHGSVGVMAQDDFTATSVFFKNARAWLLQS
jgi:serine/threonine protein kinase